MQGWILYKDSLQALKPEAFAVKRLVETAELMGIDLQVYRPEEIDIIVNREDRKSIRVNGKISQLPDFVIPRMGAAGITYFTMAVLRHLERMGVRSFNPSGSVDIVKDKLYQLQILAAHNLPIPRTMLAKFPVDADLVEQQIGFPAVVKALSGSRGRAVFLTPDKTSFSDIMQFQEATNKGANIIIQEFIENSFGRDLRVFVVGGKVKAVMMRQAANGNFKANYSLGGEVYQFASSGEIESLAYDITRILNLDITGIDLLFDKDGSYKICEVNASPGFKGIEKCCDVDIAREILSYILEEVIQTSPVQ
ncbi:MAG: RimK family alpha-L-glutamate ligase [Bacteroidia bacterium]|jgi:gamma-F420-2:alpha-L-glutamate ligase|nr:RimK family alpha-L-glutamate ligase [Bacteroidia bacterium]